MQDRRSFSQILTSLLEKPQESLPFSRENPHFPSENAFNPLDFPIVGTEFSPQAIGTLRYGVKPKSRFARKPQTLKAPLCLSFEKMTEKEKAALLFLFKGSTQTGHPESVSETEIRRQYRTKALEAHPDRTQGSSLAFQELQRHYEVLRASIDRFKATAKR